MREGTARKVWATASVLFWVLTAIYLAQFWSLGPNHTDDGLLLTYIDDMANGKLPYWDFVDAYGIFNWVLPVSFYALAGQKVWGIRVSLILVKVASVALTYALVRRTSNRFYAVLASVWMTVLLGQAWQSLQTAYAFLNVVPLVLATWYFVVCAPLSVPRHNAYVAGLLTAIAIWTKVNTGMFLFAGGLFAYFYWLPEREGSGAAPSGLHTPRAAFFFKIVRVFGALAFAVLFFVFVRRHYNIWFFLYLTVPLTIALAFSVAATYKSDDSPARYCNLFVAYLGVTTAVSSIVWFGFYRHQALAYVREIATLLAAVRYTAPFPELGVPGLYVGLNENYWLQLPWALTLLFVVWAFFARRAGERAFPGRFIEMRRIAVSLFLFATFHAYVLYARSDETHIFQALLLVVPVFFVLIFQLEAFLVVTRKVKVVPLRALVAVGALAYAGTLFAAPSVDHFDFHAGDWHNPRLYGLKYRPTHNRYVRNFSPHITDHDWDRAEDEAGAYVDSITEDGEEILVLTANRLMHINSNTRPFGGRHHYYFYLLSVELIDGEGFLRLVPRRVTRDLLLRPPRVIVMAIEHTPALFSPLPDLEWFMRRWYVHTRSFRHILVYELQVRGEQVSQPLR